MLQKGRAEGLTVDQDEYLAAFLINGDNFRRLGQIAGYSLQRGLHRRREGLRRRRLQGEEQLVDHELKSLGQAGESSGALEVVVVEVAAELGKRTVDRFNGRSRRRVVGRGMR